MRGVRVLRLQGWGIFLNDSTADRNREVGRKSQFREKIVSLVLGVLSLSYLYLI